MLEFGYVITVYYSIPVIFLQLLVSILLWRLTRDMRTWGLLVAGSLLSICGRYVILQPVGLPVWIEDVLRATAISVNTTGFFSLYFLLKRLLRDSK